MDRSEMPYIPFYRNWIELMYTKDTDAKKLAFIKGIFDAFNGDEPPRPQDMDDPHGVDYARRDGFLVAKPMVMRSMTKAESGRMGGLARSEKKQNAVRENGRLGGRPKGITKAENQSTEPKQKNQSFIKEEKEEEDIIMSSPPSPPRGEEMETKRGFHPPTESEVIAFAADGTRHAVGDIDEAWVREWYAAMARLDPPWADSRGRTIVSWQRRLISDWRMERNRRDAKADSGRKPKPGEKGGGYVDPNFKPLEVTDIRDMEVRADDWAGWKD